MQSNVVKESIVYTSYLERCNTTRDGSSRVLRKPFGDVLRDMTAMPVPDIDLSNEVEVRKYKEKCASLCAYDIGCESVPYTEKVVKRSDMRGSVVFIDIDSVKLAETIWKGRERLHAECPWVYAVWFSLRGKLHIAVRADWSGNKWHNAVWEAACGRIKSHFGFGDEFDRANDSSLRWADQQINVNHSDAAELFDTQPFPMDGLTADDRFDLDPIKPKYGELFTCKECMARWYDDEVKGFVSWYGGSHTCVFTTESRRIEYDREIAIRSERCPLNGVDETSFRYWLNDGTYYRLDVPREGYAVYRRANGRKRFVEACAMFYKYVLGMPFEDALYCTAKCYLDYCEPWIPAYADERQIILYKVARVYSDGGRFKGCESKYLCRDLVVPSPYGKPRVEGCKPSVWNGSAQYSIRKSIERQLQLDKVSELYSDGDSESVLADKLKPYFGLLKESRIRDLCKELHLRLGSGLYANAYTADGKRHKVRADKVDGVTYFGSKKDLKNNKKL